MKRQNLPVALLFDGNHLVQRVWHTTSGTTLQTRGGIPSGIIHGVLTSFCSTCKLFKPDVAYIVWDHKSRYRKRILQTYRERLESLAGTDPESDAAKILDETPRYYKEGRNKDRSEEDRNLFVDVVLPQMQELQSIMPSLGVRQLFVPDVEGDDLIGLAANILGSTHQTIIVSADKDLYQLLNINVSMYDPIKKKMFSEKDFVSTYGIQPARWTEVKALMGDPGDDIPGVPGIGEKTALKLLADYDSVVDLVEACSTMPQPTAVQKRIPKYKEQIRMAYDLSYILAFDEELDADQAGIFAQQWTTTPEVNWTDVQNFVDIYELKKVHQELQTLLVKVPLEASLSACSSVQEMFAAWGECERCPLFKTRNKIVRFGGKARANVMFLGEGPGPSEDLYGEPFVGKAGKYFAKLLAQAGLSREDVHISNIVCCFPNEHGEIRPPDEEEVDACSPRLRAQIRLVRPKLIVLLGDKALKAFFPDAGKISVERGMLKEHAEWPGIQFFPVFHPSYVMRLPQSAKDAHSDVIKTQNDWRLIRSLGDSL